MKRIDDGVADLGALDDRRDLAGTQQWHGGDDHAAGLEDAEPAGEQSVAIGSSQQHAVAGDKAFLLDQQAGDAAGEFVQVCKGPAAVGVDDGKVDGFSFLQQLGRRVQPLGIVEQK